MSGSSPLSINDRLALAANGPFIVQAVSAGVASVIPFVAPPPPPPPPPPTTNEQLPFHVFSADNKCSPLTTADCITQWAKTPIVPGNEFRLVWHASDPSNGILVELDFTTDGTEPHTTSQRVWKNDILTMEEIHVVSGPNTNHDIAPNEFIDFYSDGDSGQMFWYGPGANSINFSMNFQGFGTSFNFTDLSVTIERLKDAVKDAPLEFSVLDVNIVELGQISNVPTPIPIGFVQEPNVSPCSRKAFTVTNTNVCHTFQSFEVNNLFGGIRSAIRAKMTNM